jgi:crotonobetainyl-CoA:carnitine CoA-transferase CaiB-like acyl-CoA transferase
MTQFQPTYESIAGLDRTPHSHRRRMVPSILRTGDGWVGFTLVTGAQIQDFFSMIGRQDWAEEPSLLLAINRSARSAELLSVVEPWMEARTTDEVTELAALFRLPAVRIERPDTVTSVPHFVAAGFYTDHPDGDFVRPGVPYRLHGVEAPGTGAAPARHAGGADRPWPDRSTRPAPPASTGAGRRPLDGVRVLDLTRLWSGPMATQLLAGLGADVVRVESAAHPDPFRLPYKPAVDETRWYEWGPVFHALNTGKRSVGIDPGSEGGRQVLRRMVGWADVVIENFTPRVMTQIGLDWDDVHRLDPRVIVVRMPAFGLDGPWRDRPGFAPTMEQLSGLTHLTGWPEGPPIDPYGTGDPMASMHTVLALLLALDHRDRTGEGVLVEAPLVTPTLSAAADLVVEWSAYGTRPGRAGNRHRSHAPQGVYRSRDEGEGNGDGAWIALTVATEEQWHGLLAVVAADGPAEWIDRHRGEDRAGRRRCHDELDAGIAAWAAGRSAQDAVDRLLAAGVPAAPVIRPNDVLGVEPIRDRSFYPCILEHPVIGRHPLPEPAVLLAASGRPSLRTPAPTFGQHNIEVLAGEVGFTEAEVQALQAAGAVRTTIG